MTKERTNTKTIDETLAIRWLRPSGWAAPSSAKIAACAVAFLMGAGLGVLADDNRAPDVPDTIKVDDGNKVHFHGFGVGVQIYTWNGISWGGAVPEATLFDDEGNVVADHFGVFDVNGAFVGPAWQSNSGSKVVGLLPPKAIIVNTDAIPWLRLNADPENTEGPGIFAETTFIQRVNTTGGKAPDADGAFVGQVARVPYTADYFFYRHSND